MKLFCILLLFFFTLSCSQKVDTNQEDYTNFYAASSAGKKQYLSCNFFSDETFRGRIWKSLSNSEPYCLDLEIDDYPKQLLENEDLFLQIYPFSIGSEGKKIQYGPSVAINTINQIKEGDEVLIKSQIIDSHIVKTELGLDANYFFSDHLLEVCNLDLEWEGLQLVIYERRSNQDPAPIRITKFLIPPFLAHPEHFKHEKGEALAAFHPFLELIPQYKSKAQSYYDLAEETCL